DDSDGTVAALAFMAAGATRVSCELALVALQREASGPDGIADLRFLQSFASAAGAHFARPGIGPAGALHRQRFASPGRVLASAVPGAAAAGALGLLALPACALECAAAMAGEPLLMPRPRVASVELTGVCDPGVSGIHVLAAVERRLAGEGVGAVLECRGTGLYSLTLADRLCIAARAGAVAGALATLFPSDDRTRAWLRSRGRDADWRRLEPSEQGFDTRVSLDLSQGRPVRADAVHLRAGPLAEGAGAPRLALGNPARHLARGRGARPRIARGVDRGRRAGRAGGRRRPDPGSRRSHGELGPRRGRAPGRRSRGRRRARARRVGVRGT